MQRLHPGLALLAIAGLASSARAQCPEQGPIQHWTGAGSTVCPCFVQGEEWGASFANIPASHYPIEILRVGFGWGSVGGGAPDQLEDSINVYAGGLPNPGAAVFTLPGPVLTDGVINEFDIEPFGAPVINSGPVTVTIRLLNDSSIFDPAPVHDGNGCQGGGRNVVFAVPGGWMNACSLGVTGDWLVHIVYRGSCDGQSYCYGTPFDCPCGNGGAAPSGCHLAQGNGGVFLAFSSVVPDGMGGGTGLITGTNFPPAGQPGVITLRNTSPQLAPPHFGDGILCVGASGIVRLGAGTALNGTYTHNYVHGVMAGPGTFYYQLWFRNTPAMFCTPDAFNLSNGWELTWP
jgi:hypothetical protein